MERVAFMVEGTGERISCLLNPETIVVRRLAGIRPRRSSGARWTGVDVSESPVLVTGGGRTEIELDLLFDVKLSNTRQKAAMHDVRDLTQPIWKLSEVTRNEGRARGACVRFVWGKSWNIPAVVDAVSERFDQFSPEGHPRRSWMRVRLLRVTAPALQRPTPAPDADGMAELAQRLSEQPVSQEVHSVRSERLDQIAQERYGNPAYWRLLASVNDVDDPLDVAQGVLLSVPERGGAS
jgi:hypothetical protein